MGCFCKEREISSYILKFESESIAFLKKQNDTHKYFKTRYIHMRGGGSKLENDDVIFRGGSGNDDG